MSNTVQEVLHAWMQVFSHSRLGEGFLEKSVLCSSFSLFHFTVLSLLHRHNKQIYALEGSGQRRTHLVNFIY